MDEYRIENLFKERASNMIREIGGLNEDFGSSRLHHRLQSGPLNWRKDWAILHINTYPAIYMSTSQNRGPEDIQNMQVSDSPDVRFGLSSQQGLPRAKQKLWRSNT